MKIRVMSDLHLEFAPMAIEPLPDDKATVLVLAGDIGLPTIRGELNDSFFDFFADAANQFKSVIYVLGNHEYYRGTYRVTLQKIRDQINHMHLYNVHVLERQTQVIDNVAFIGATLWTDYDRGNPMSMIRADQYLNDHHLIKNVREDSRVGYFTTQDAYEDHCASRDWIFNEVVAQHTAGNKAVVVVHHGVSPQSTHESYRRSDVNGAFVSNLEHVIDRTSPELVIHGHVHSSFDYMIGTSRVVVNPRGYPGEKLATFDPVLTVEV